METNSDSLGICRGCFCSDGTLYYMNPKLLQQYSEFIGIKISITDCNTPAFLCYICKALLHKSRRFKENCLRNRRVLDNIKLNKSINILKNLHLAAEPYCQQTRIQTHDYQPQEIDLHNAKITFVGENINKIPSMNISNEFEVKIEEINDDQVWTSDPIAGGDDTNISQISDQCNVKSSHDAKISQIDTVNKSNTKEYTNELDSADDHTLVIESSPKSYLNKNYKAKERDRRSTKKRINRKARKEGRKKYKIESEVTVDGSNDTKVSQKRFETKENLSDFEKMFNVEIAVLSKEEQQRDVLDRKKSVNYLHSPYRCEQCFKGFMDKDNLHKHSMTQHDLSRGLIVCEFCKFRYKDKRGLNQHLKKHRLKFICRQCKYVSRTTFSAKEHYKMHSGQIHECKHCGKSYGKLSSHLSHMRVHHPLDLVWCEYCGEPFIGQFGLNGHKKRAHRDLIFPSDATCDTCSTHFTNVSALKVHISRSKEGACETGCVHCGLGFDDSLKLKDHLLDSHRRKKKYPCEKCDKTFAKESLYSSHYRRIHADSSAMPVNVKNSSWICEVCGKSLPSKCVLVYHQRNHTGERPYQCATCAKSFTMRKLLQSHLRVHTNARPYSCKLCPKTFKGLAALRAHENVHSGVKQNVGGK